MLSLCLLLLVAAGETPPDTAPPETAPPETAPPDPAPPDPAPPPSRCIVHYDGRHRVCGELTSRDEQTVHITDDAGLQHSIPLPRVVAIEPLLELPAPAEGVVELLDGRQLRGLLKRDGCDAVEIMLHGTPIELDRLSVARVWILAPLAERYAELKRAMPLERPGAHLALCRWLVQEKAWELAVPELEAHAQAHRSADAIRLLRVAKAHQAIGRQRGGEADTDAVDTPRPKSPEPVDDAAVNLIRVYELDLSDPPPLRIDENTRQAFLDAYRTSTLLPQTEEGRAALLAGEPIDILQLMFAHRAREYYGAVRVLQEPDALRRFRQSVHDLWLLPRCGSTDCHGGPDAGRFRLLKGKRIDDRIRASNLLILDALVLDGRPMIDWNDPERSTLLQYALPADNADRPHPPVAGWRPAMDSPKSVSAVATVKWIESMMRSPRPDYPVEPPIALPVETPATPRLPR